MYQIDNQSRQAVYEQIIEQIERYVLLDALTAGEKMPSVRNLSMQLNVNPNTVQRAYTDLERLGVLAIAPARGAFVADGAKALLEERRTTVAQNQLRDLLRDLKQLGLSADEILSFVQEALKEGTKND